LFDQSSSSGTLAHGSECLTIETLVFVNHQETFMNETSHT